MIDYATAREVTVREFPGFKAKDFPLHESSSANVAEITLSKPYPKSETEWALNTVSTMIAYILAGRVEFSTEGEHVLLEAGDVIRIPANQAYSWNPKPEVTMLIFSTPAWTPEQHETVKR